MQSQASVGGLGRTQEQEGKAMEEKHMNEFISADFWASPLITWIMKTSGVPGQSFNMKIFALCAYVKPEVKLIRSREKLRSEGFITGPN